PLQFMEQDESLSTWRFDENGQPLNSAQGGPSWVSGGHGLLIRLFPEVKKRYPAARSVFIRNIDNIQGRNAEAKAASKMFFSFYNFLLVELDAIRTFLRGNQTAAAESRAARIVQMFDLPSGASALETLQRNLFHTPQSVLDRGISYAFERPLNFLGMV